MGNSVDTQNISLPPQILATFLIFLLVLPDSFLSLFFEPTLFTHSMPCNQSQTGLLQSFTVEILLQPVFSYTWLKQ